MSKYQWEKKGFIYGPNGRGFFKTHAARSIPFQINSRTLRLYITSRDSYDRLMPSFIDVEISNPKKIIQVNKKTLLSLGKIGTFDDSGITPGSIVRTKKATLIYYTGWKRRRINVPYEMSIGVCKMKIDGSFERFWEGPILAQDRYHPLMTAGPYVLLDEGIFKMWYCSATEWKVYHQQAEPLYNVHYAESKNGFDWVPRKKAVINYNYPGEVISAPWVIKESSKYLMWYSTRGSKDKIAKRYTIGYAESDDGLSWTRKDKEVGIALSKSGWDSEMICYPSFFSFEKKTYLFYSGNKVGKGGVGYAEMERLW